MELYKWCKLTNAAWKVSVSGENGKYRPEKLRIRTLFTQGKRKTFSLISVDQEGVISRDYRYIHTFRTLSNIYDESLHAKIANGLELLAKIVND